MEKPIICQVYLHSQKSGQKLVNIPKACEIAQGDYVLIRKVEVREE